MLFWFMILICFIAFIIMMLNLFLSKKNWLDRNKMISFECGFDCLSSSRLPFSVHFYLIGILFLIFDIEIIYLFPIIDLFKFSMNLDWLFLGMMILLILYLGLEFEKKEGTLKWFF